MSDVEKALEDLRKEISALAAKMRWELPPVLTKKMAAAALSVGATKLDGLIRKGVLLTCEVGKVKMVPASEVYRLAQPARTESKPAPKAKGRPKKARDARSDAEKIRALAKAIRKRR